MISLLPRAAVLLLLGGLILAPLAAQDIPLEGGTYRIEKLLDTNFAVSLAYAPDGRLFYTEKNTGNVRVVAPDGRLQSAPVIHLPTDGLQERGMLGIAIDPNFTSNGYIWVMHTAPGSASAWPSNRIVRFTERDGTGHDPLVMLDVPIETGELLHNGGNLHFDAAGALVVSIGDYGMAAYAQDPDAPQGKIHRFRVAGDALVPAEDNPRPASSVLAYGLRNPYDFAFDPVDGRIYASENGPDCDDEINFIIPGLNYGWHEGYTCAGRAIIHGLAGIYAPPMLSFTPTIAPTGILVYDGAAFPAWQGDLLFCSWNYGELYRAQLSAVGNAVEALTVVDLGGVPCRLDLVAAPDGSLVFSTLVDGVGAIYRITPAE
jgi:aldose sugar dehydrogenase